MIEKMRYGKERKGRQREGRKEEGEKGRELLGEIDQNKIYRTNSKVGYRDWDTEDE